MFIKMLCFFGSMIGCGLGGVYLLIYYFNTNGWDQLISTIQVHSLFHFIFGSGVILLLASLAMMKRDDENFSLRQELRKYRSEK